MASALALSSSSSRIMSSYSYEMRPRLLKDFLSDDSSVPSCSFGGFNKKPTSSHSRLLRSRSKSASISISAIHKASEVVIKAIKFFPFASIVKKPSSPSSFLPRSLSRKKSRRDRNRVLQSPEELSVLGDHDDQTPVSTPKIKDILRWKSFRDVVDDLSTSWLETDFTPEDLNSLENENDDQNNSKSEGRFEFFDENEQQSPVSVLDDSPFRDDDDHEADQPVSLFNRKVATMERRKHMLMLRIAEFETLATLEPFTNEEVIFTKQQNKPTSREEEETNWEVEAKARELLHRVMTESLITINNSDSDKNNDIHNENFTISEIDMDDIVLLDFFRHELANNNRGNTKQLCENEMVKMAKDWMSRDDCCAGKFDSGLLDNRETCLKDMETGPIRWSNNNFYVEQQDLGRDLEIHVLNHLLDELWADLVTQQKI